jgi:Flp pilus assembly protein TadG
VVALEVLLLFPILVIMLLAVVEFGLIMAAGKHVEFASRLGAKLAAESSNLELFNAPSTMDNLKDQVDQYLNTAGYTDSCQVLLEHNVTGVANPSQANPLMADCPCTPVSGPIGSLPPESVRVTVCLPMTGNIPNSLETFGFDISGCVIRQSVVWIYEQ